MTAEPPRLGVLASGSGTILAAVVASGIDVSAVIVDRPCTAVDVATSAGVEVEVVQREGFGAEFDRVAYTGRVLDALKRHQIDLVAMAGFGTVLAAPLFEVYEGRVLNTHPSLLPAFPGWHSVRDALDHGVKVTGTTVHVATEAVDAGPILAQEAVPVEPGDSVESLHERIKAVERRVYPEAIRSFMASYRERREETT